MATHDELWVNQLLLSTLYFLLVYFFQYILCLRKQLHHCVYFSESTWWAWVWRPYMLCVFVAKISFVFFVCFHSIAFKNASCPFMILSDWISACAPESSFHTQWFTDLHGRLCRRQRQNKSTMCWYMIFWKVLGKGSWGMKVTGAERWIVPDWPGRFLDINPDSLKRDLFGTT